MRTNPHMRKQPAADTPIHGSNLSVLLASAHSLTNRYSVTNAIDVIYNTCTHLSPLLHSVIQSDSFLCDCQLHWLPEWLVTRGLQVGVNATCAHPESLKGTSIFQAPSSSFVCGELCVCLVCVYVSGCVEQEPQ